MAPPLSLKYVEDALAKGYSEEQIKKSLRAQGVKDGDINAVFGALKQKNNFLAGNVKPHPEQSARVMPASPSQGGQGEESSRMQYAEEKSGGSKTKWLIIAIAFLILVGSGVAIYYNYSDQIFKFLGFGETEEQPILPEVPTEPEPVACAMDAKECPDGSYVSRVAPSCEFAECPEIVMTPEEIKIDNILSIQNSLASYFKQNSVYPQTVTNSDIDGFYCYRKNGSHYVLGTVLPEGNMNLIDDLDGSYYCGQEIKDCADPVYCVEP